MVIIMKKIYIFSDTHGGVGRCLDILRDAESVGGIIHAGDCENDARYISDAFPNIPVYSVRGNCDFFSQTPNELVCEVEGVRIFVTHGHMYDVKYESNYRSLVKRAKEAGADLTVFGHTHIPYLDTDGKFTVVNPGSMRYGRTYAVASLENGSVRVDMMEG